MASRNIISTITNISSWPVKKFSDITAKHIADLIVLRPELIIIGSGNKARFLPDQCSFLALSNNIGIETMDSGAACRSYNLLQSDGRRIVAGLLLPGAD